MGLLLGSSVYLIGAIDHEDDPRGWRTKITTELLHPRGVHVYDPLIKPSWFTKDSEHETPKDEIGHFKNFLQSYSYCSDTVRHATNLRMQEIRKMCLSMVSNSNFIIGKLPKKFTVGTMEELSLAVQCGKPILLYLPDGMDTSTWLPAQIGPSFYENSFTTLQGLYDRIQNIDCGEVNVNTPEWLFLSYFNDKDVINEFSNNKQVGS